MIRVFLSYSHVDEKHRDELAKHLMSLKRQGLIESWHDRRIAPGEEWANRIDEELRRADIILLLVSIDFINSEYCYELEMKEALARHERGEAIVIPIILRPCHWTGLPFGKLQAATRDGKPVEKYPTLDDAFLEITKGIEAVAKRLSAQTYGSSRASSISSAISRNLGTSQAISQRPELPHSSNLAIPKTFTDHDKDTFVTEAFSYITNLFEGSLEELQKRNPEITTRFERINSRSFEAAIYRNGSQVSKCGIWLGSLFGLSRGSSSIAFSYSGVGQGNSFNENMSVEDNGNMLGLRPMGMGRFQGDENKLLTNNGAAEYYWSLFFEPVQRR
jgi:hypothetical protein